MSLITAEQVVLDLTGADRHEATRVLAERLVASGRCTDLQQFLADVTERESKMATGLPGGIGIPHARSEAITEPSLVFGRAGDGIDWGAKDGPATLVFLIAAPAGGGDAHMQMLPKLARALMKKDFKDALAAATSPEEVVRIVSAEVALDAPAGSSAAASAPAGTSTATPAAAATTAAAAPATATEAAPPAATPAPAAATTTATEAHRHRAHLHGGRGPRGRGGGGRPHHDGRDAGLCGLQAPVRGPDRRGRRRDLRP
jgi:PTS system fructose-specific IIC component